MEQMEDSEPTANRVGVQQSLNGSDDT